jgi:hypothetical protein
MITLSHSAEQGTLAQGTSRGDGSAPILKNAGFRWSRTLEAWYLPRSRDRRPQTETLNTVSSALGQAGLAVETTVDTAVRTTAEKEADRATRSVERADRHETVAARLSAKADREEATADRYGQQIPPMGQPILAGHHSESRHRKSIDRHRAFLSRSLETEKAAQRAAASAAAAATETAQRHAPVAVGNRIKTTESELRSLQRQLTATTTTDADKPWAPDHAKDLRERISEATDRLAYWQGIRASQIEAGLVVNYSKETISKGDAIKYAGTWYRVERVNAKSVSIRQSLAHSWTDTVDYHTIIDHRSAG